MKKKYFILVCNIIFVLIISSIVTLIYACNKDETTKNSIPVVSIKSPTDSSKYFKGDSVTLKCEAFDNEDGKLTGNSIVWVSDKDNLLGYGETLITTKLSVNSHKITVTVTDKGKLTAFSVVYIKILNNNNPTIEIAKPTNNSLYMVNDSVILECNANDAEDGVLSGNSISWKSDKDGILGISNTLIKTNLSANTHTIIATVTDSKGLVSSDTIKITVGLLEGLMQWLSGSFSNNKQFNQPHDPYIVDVRLKMRRIWSTRTDGYWLYVEQAYANQLTHPYRQRIYNIFIENDTIKDDIYKIPNETTYVGMWNNPDAFNNLTPAQLTLKIGCGLTFNWRQTNNSFFGTTHGKNCSASGIPGVTYLTSQSTITKTFMTSWDLGFNNNNDTVMGPTVPYKFDKLLSFPTQK